jgi:cupin 2 domain-containing protein
MSYFKIRHTKIFFAANFWVCLTMQNIYELPQELNHLEKFEQIVSGKNIQIERIISTGQTTPSGQWYDQTTDEWVILLQGEAELSYVDDSRIKLKAGDYLLIPAHTKHRVEYTSVEPACIWLAVHGQLSP